MLLVINNIYLSSFSWDEVSFLQLWFGILWILSWKNVSVFVSYTVCSYIFHGPGLPLILIFMLRKLESLLELVPLPHMTANFFWILVILHCTLRYTFFFLYSCFLLHQLHFFFFFFIFTFTGERFCWWGPESVFSFLHIWKGYSC